MAEPAADGRTGFLAILHQWSPAIVTVVAVAGGYWLLVDTMLDGLKENIAALRAETGLRLDGREAEGRDIRAVIQSTNEALRADMGKLGDRIVQSNLEIGARIDKMRDDIVKTMQEGDARLERRFDRLDEKFDTLLTRINYDIIVIPWEKSPLFVEKDGLLLGPDGKPLGSLPAVLKFDQQ